MTQAGRAVGPNPIKAALQAGESVFGIWSQSGSPDLAEAAVRVGWPAVFVDNEHGVTDLNAAVAIHRAVLSAGGDVVLRVPSTDPTYLKRALDRGFRSLMVPMIGGVAQAEALAAACRYPPRGVRGYAAPVVRASGYGTDHGYAANAHRDLLLIAQIEHRDAAAAAADIAAVDGIDCLFIGPNDLAGSLNALERLGAPEVLAACEQVEAAARMSGKWLGSIPRPGRESVADLLACGARLIAGPSDVALFVHGAAAARAVFRADPNADPKPAP